ncbi:MAG: hypothetical protein ACP5MB_11220 [bacterium]
MLRGIFITFLLCISAYAITPQQTQQEKQLQMQIIKHTLELLQEQKQQAQKDLQLTEAHLKELDKKLDSITSELKKLTKKAPPPVVVGCNVAIYEYRKDGTLKEVIQTNVCK